MKIKPSIEKIVYVPYIEDEFEPEEEEIEVRGPCFICPGTVNAQLYCDECGDTPRKRLADDDLPGWKG